MKTPKHYSQSLLDESKINEQILAAEEEWIAKQLLADEKYAESRIKSYVRRGYSPVRKINED